MFTPRHRYRYSKVRFFEREHGTEFLRFEMDQMRRFAEAKKARGRVELDGYVAWLRPPHFVLVPAPTALGTYMVCRAGGGVPYPDMNQFSTVRGKVVPDVVPGGRIYHVLQADSIHSADPGFGQIKPEITHKDFVGLLFEKWRNVADTTQEMIAHGLTSSPAMPGSRAGGFTVTIDSLTRNAILDTLAADLRRFVPSEVRSGRAPILKVPEMGGATPLVVQMPVLGWQGRDAPLERIPRTVDAGLDRTPRGAGAAGAPAAAEYSITLLKRAGGPLPLEQRGVRMSDYPAILEEHAERKSYSYDTSAEVFKFLLAARMHRPAVSTAVLKSSIEKYSGLIGQFVKTREYLSATTGSGQFLDMGFAGRPLSVYNVAATLARSRAAGAVSDQDIERAGAEYFENLTAVFDVLHDGAYADIRPGAPVRYAERRMFAYLGEHPGSSADDAAAALGITAAEAGEALGSLHARTLLYEPAAGRYTTIPIGAAA